ncbi:DNA phosphorothioation system sulfurtransferase DndC [Dehalococcoidia bacterium]|nr:DNA phosphorothioation system sulfurtransferase DndC [Dehalococcoidia bacterium]
MADFKINDTGMGTLSPERLEEIYERTRRIYRSNRFPWVVGFSGGKDSTATLQVVWQALAGLPPDERTKPVYVLSSDTLVETPVIVDLIDRTLEQINRTAANEQMPFEAHKVIPQIEDTFWVNLIGKGYPAPYRRFRWCTDRLKIKPANRFILKTAAKFGEVVVVLGVRKAESMTRAQAMSLTKIAGSDLRRHSTLPNAHVYAPIEDLTTDEVWSYLLTIKSPWGSQNRDLLALYRSANQGECPLVVDTTTPSCGNSRFGCWVCTVVERDNSMEALIDNGEEWLEPLLDLRDLLSSTQDPEAKIRYRGHKRRGGKISYKEDGDIARGPYHLDFCRLLLRRLLEAQQAVSRDPKGSELELISLAELHEIRRIWRNERSDWADSVPTIHYSVMERHIDWPVDDSPTFDTDDETLLQEICEREGVPLPLVTKLLDTERQHQGMARRAGVFDRLSRVLAEDWRTEDEARAKIPES